ncbi:MAG: ligase-associated DNA damage response endonuclease PdeM [Pseudomonadota bacterium]
MMNAPWQLASETVELRTAGTVWWPGGGLLVVGDLHLGRAEGMARRRQPFLPPYAEHDTLQRLSAEIAATTPTTLALLGDSFDDAESADATAARLAEPFAAFAARTRLIWIAGNHDPRPIATLPGDWVGELTLGPFELRHIAASTPPAPGRAEISAHFHPRAEILRRGARVRRRCFLADAKRVILPAFGTYTGGLDVRHPCMSGLVGADAAALMIGRRVVPVPLDRLG